MCMSKLFLNLTTVTAVGLLLAAPAVACNYPVAPRVPNGETAEDKQMLEAQSSVRAYLSAAEAYLACLENMQTESGEPLPPRQAEINVARYNAMVEEMHRVSDEYNIAVRIFKARNP